MAGRVNGSGLSRRAALGALAGAGLTATAPSFAAPAPTAPRLPFPVRLKEQPAYERLRELIEPGSDAFACEARAVEFQALLQRFGETGEMPLAPGFRGRGPFPAGVAELSPEASAARFSNDELDAAQFRAEAARWLESLGPRPSIRWFPLEEDKVRYEALAADGRYIVGEWRVESADGLVSRLEPLNETTARRTPASQRFEPANRLLFDPDDLATQQLAVGVPEWRRRLDPACGIDIHGQNGIAVGDIDGSGWDAIYVCQPGGLPNRLLVRDKDGVYRDRAKEAGVDLLDSTSSALFVDLENAGRQDLVALTTATPLLFRNRGAGRFELVEDAFEFSDPPRGSFTSLAAADYDGDGFLDLYLCTYIYYQSEDQYSYPSPYHDSRNGPPNYLFRNRLAENGRFEDVTAQVGLDQNNDRYSFAAAWCDYDFDGRPELYVANDFGRNNLYHFDGKRFRDIAAKAGVEDLGPGMSAAWFDAHGHGRPDLYVTNMWTPSGRRVTHDPAFAPVAQHGLQDAYHRHTKGNTLYRNLGDGRFEETGEAEMGRWSWSGDGVDFDLDGKPEILVMAGMITEPDDSKPDLMSFFWRRTVALTAVDDAASPKYEEGWDAVNQYIREGYSWNGREPNVLHKRCGNRWVDFSGLAGLGAMDSRAFAAIDLDGDGRLDLLLKNRLGPQLTAWLNRPPAAHGSIVLELEGKKSNRDAVGAWVTVESANGVTGAGVNAGSGYLSQHTKRLHIGLGAATTAKATVHWPAGGEEVLPELRSGRRYTVREGEGVVAEAPLERPDRVALRDMGAVSPKPEPSDVWLLEPLPLPERRPGPGFLVLADGPADSAQAGVTWLDLSRDPERAAWYALFQRYLLDYRGPLELPTAYLLDERSRVHKLYRRLPDEADRRVDLRVLQEADRSSLALPYPGLAHATTSRNPFRHGAALYQAGYTDQALPYFEATLSAAPDNFKALLASGQIHLDAGRLVTAAERLETAAKLKPESPEAWNNLGGLAMARNDPQQAVRHYQKALDLRPDAPYALQNAAQAYEDLGNSDEAEGLLRRALELNPQDSDTANRLGLLVAKQGRLPDAKTLFEQAIAARRDNASALNNLAIVYLQLNQPNDAEAALRFAIRAAPGSEEAYLNLARVYIQGGDRPRALGVIEQLLAESPDSAAGRRAMEELTR